MKYRYIHISAALFLVTGMAVIYSTDGKLLTASENLAGRRYNAHDYLHTSHF